MLKRLGYTESDWTRQLSQKAGRKEKAIPDFVFFPKGEKHFFTEFELNPVSYSVDITVPPAGWDPKIGARGSFDKITLGENEFFVLGDNRLSCVDSRLFGKVNVSEIKKRVLMSYYPFNQIKIFKSQK